MICKLHVPSSIHDTGPRGSETELWDQVIARGGGLHPDQLPQAAAVNCLEERVPIKVIRGRLRKLPVVVQELARRCDESIVHVPPHLHRDGRVRFYRSLTSSIFFGLENKTEHYTES